ncbi:MAG: Hsp70 family protein [Clostridia bacterium]|nr:Hsp70 family protein [Clostridia bacterium]
MAEQIEYFGIDFGTTNIAVGGLIVDHDNKKALRVMYGEDGVPFPSILAVKPKDDGTDKMDTIFGRRVKTQVATMQDDGYTIIKSIKTSLGSDAIYKVGTRKLDPTTIVMGLVWAIKRHLSKNIGRKVEVQHATVAVPVDFTNRQREELSKAFRRAGIEVDKIVSESVAAYIRNRGAVKGLSNVMVFDWGGGTLDISLLRSDGGQVYEESTIGWKVAGDYIDEKIAEYVHNQIVNNPAYQITTAYKDLSIKDKIKILSECEKAKIYFSDEDEIDRPANISMFEYCGEKTIRYKLSYEIFCEIIKPIVIEAVELIGSALKKANKNMIDLNAIIMVGGSSKLLPLKSIIQDEFQNKYKIRIVYPDKPQWSVAEGAALIDSLDCEYKLNQDISVVMSDGTPHPIIRKGTGIPFDGETVTFGTVNSATSANFIFADDRDNILGDISMPAKGFLGEYFEVVGKITNSLVAEISVTGNRMMATVGTKTLEINQLSYYCDISDLDDFKFEVI